jgi:phosphatidylglycerol---prolipoprotein diacylglyceryl transferase
MQFPVNIHIGQIVLSSHLVCELLAYSIGFRYFLFLRKNNTDKISTENRTIILISAALGSFVFSRIIGFMESTEFFIGEFSFVNIYGNKTILGGLLGGLFAVEICKKIIGVKHSSGDLMTYPILLAMIIGRIGCFLSGLEDGTYGIATTLPWAINFGDNIYRHPTNLYEIIFLILTWLAIYFVEKRYILANGTKFKMFLFSYFVYRLLVEYIKPINKFPIGLSAIQITSIIGIIYYYKIILFPRTLIEAKRYA